MSCDVGSASLTVSTRVEIDDASYAHVDDAEEALVLLLELLLVKYLNRQNTVLGDPPVQVLALCR
jgi:hypothetical protein